jgi:hypothetical protein
MHDLEKIIFEFAVSFDSAQLPGCIIISTSIHSDFSLQVLKCVRAVRKKASSAVFTQPDISIPSLLFCQCNTGLGWRSVMF